MVRNPKYAAGFGCLRTVRPRTLTAPTLLQPRIVTVNLCLNPIKELQKKDTASSPRAVLFW